MKIQIINNNNQTVSGYQNIHFNSFDNEFNNISNNSCEEIIAPDIIDYVEFKEIIPTIEKLIRKLRLGGSMVIGGKDINLFAKYIKNNSINETDASNIICACKSLVSYKTIENILQQMNIKYTIQLNGVSYEIRASR